MYFEVRLVSLDNVPRRGEIVSTAHGATNLKDDSDGPLTEMAKRAVFDTTYS